MKVSILFWAIVFSVFAYGQEPLTLENLPQYSTQELEGFMSRPMPSLDFNLPKLKVEQSSENGKSEGQKLADGSTELLLYRSDGTLAQHIVSAPSNSTAKLTLYSNQNMRNLIFSRRIYDLRKGQEHQQSFFFADKELTTIEMITGFIVDSKTDGSLGEYSVFRNAETGKLEINLFWSNELDEKGRVIRGHLYLRGSYIRLRELFYEGESRVPKFIRHWIVERKLAGERKLKLEEVMSLEK